MEIAFESRGISSPWEYSAVTIGMYDGVHIGHRAVLSGLRSLADELDLPTALVTFDRHPAEVLNPGSVPPALTELDQRLELLNSTGCVDLAVVLNFDEERRNERAPDFVRRVLVDGLGAKAVIVGSDFRFGFGREGSVELLEALGDEHNFEVIAVDLVGTGGTDAVSSTRVREALARGDVSEASRLLGRPHEVRGLVVRGVGRGRSLGFPTANIEVSERICMPLPGIYAGVAVDAGGAEHIAAICLGTSPTFNDDSAALVLEVHILDFDADIYGERLAVRFVERLRGEERFEGVEPLVEQMKKDCAAAREVVAIKS